MAVQSAYLGEDVPLKIDYTDSSDSAVDVDDTTSGPTITITAPDGTETVSSTVMTQLSTGEYEYVWDTSGLSTGKYDIEIAGEFSSETEITRDVISIR